MRIFFCAIILACLTSVANAGGYSKCMLEHSPSLQTANVNSLDAIILSCINLNEEPIGEPDILKIKIQKSFVKDRDGKLVLIELIYNGSQYDVTSITFNLKDKRTNDTTSYRFDQFNENYKGEGIVISPAAPQHRRFIKSQTSEEYVFLLNLPRVVNANTFNDQFEIGSFYARGIR